MEQEFGVEILRRAGYGPAGPEVGGAIRIAVELYGGDCIVESARAQTEAEISRWGGKTYIVVHPRLSPQRGHFAVARMVAREEMRRAGVVGDENALAAFLVAPTQAVRRRFYRAGLALPELADSFCVTQTCLAMRVVEVGEAEGVVVTPERVYRPKRCLSWVSDESARKLARTNPRSLRKVPIVDEPGRTALFKRAG